MNENGSHKKIDIEELRKVAHTIDFLIYLIDAIGEHLKKLRDNLIALPHEFPTVSIAEKLSNALDSINAASGLIIKFFSSEKMDSEKSDELWNLHSALLLYYHDALMLLRHSLLSAFTGYYNVAFTELRNAVESIVRGTIFDLLAFPEYRKNAEELRKIGGFEGAEGFHELLKILENELDDERPNVSAEIFDIMDRKLKEFNPRASYTRLLKQLLKWNIIDEEAFRNAESCYKELSTRTHRVHPKFSEVGSRIMAQRDWIELEPVPELLLAYLHYFIHLNGIFAFLTLKTISLDLAQDEFRECIELSELKQYVDVASSLAKKYELWKKVMVVIRDIKGSAARDAEQFNMPSRRRQDHSKNFKLDG